jgi:signal transduction histidine kinase
MLLVRNAAGIGILSTHLPLRGMRERLQSMAGTLKLTGSANEGTSLEITLPLASDSPTPQIVGEGDVL